MNCARCNNKHCTPKPDVKHNIVYCNKCELWFTKDLSKTDEQIEYEVNRITVNNKSNQISLW